MKLSYKQKFIILFISFGTLIVVGTLASFYYLESKNIKDDFVTNSKTIMISKQETIKSYFNRIKNLTLTIKKALEEEGSYKNFERYGRLASEISGELLNISLAHPNGKLIDSKEIEKTEKTPLTYKEDPKTNTVLFSAIKNDPVLKDPVMRTSVPVFFGNRHSGTLFLTFNVAPLFDSIDKSPVGYIHLCDEEGNFLIYKDGFRHDKTTINLKSEFGEIADDILFADYYVGVEMFAQTITLGGGKKLKIIFQMKNDTIEKKKHAILNLGIMIMAAVLALSIPLAYLFSIIPDRLNRKLEDLNKNLERRVVKEVAIRQEKEKMLVHQSKMASMGEMIGAIAHQWRQPLNTIGLIVITVKDLFRRGMLTEAEIEAEMGRLEYQLEFMSKTIDDFRNFFKADKEKADFDVLEAVQEVLTLLSSQILKESIAVSFLYKENGIEKANIGLDERTNFGVQAVTLGYKNEFKQVILNLINNAKDIIVEKDIEGRIEIVVNKTEEAIEVSVKDNGGGIPEDTIDKIFKPYFSTKGDKGTGVGLDLAKTIIEKNMGGELTVQNINGGAMFSVTLHSFGAKIEKEEMLFAKSADQPAREVIEKQQHVSTKEEDEEYMAKYYSSLENVDDNVIYNSEDFLKTTTKEPKKESL